MRYLQIHPKTRREDPRDAHSPGTILLVRAGFIQSAGAAGIWAWTPLGLRVRRNMEKIVRAGMERAGAVEIELPILQSRELWNETGRWDKYQQAGISFCVKDRRKSEFMLAPTAEELVVDYFRKACSSYRDLPTILWQMSPKFRDELRPRQGLVRGREFLMKDAYSFGKSHEQMIEAYQRMAEVYHWIFQQVGFNYIQVEADSGAIGGEGSSEFMAITEHGEDVLLNCSVCGYGANAEKATTRFDYPFEEVRGCQRISTPNIRTVEELELALGVPAAKMVKTIVMFADGRPIVISMRGDLEINEVKAKNLLKASEVGTADAGTVEAVTGAPVGFAGPIGLYGVKKFLGDQEVKYYFDSSVQGLSNFLCGGNQEDVHYVNVNIGRDFPAPERYYDLCTVRAGLHCPRCEHGVLSESQGIELGHIFQLQQIYSGPMQATFRTEDTANRDSYWMGCYGIGVSRMVQALAEQRHDEKGLIWPASVAPFRVAIVPAGPQHLEAALGIYGMLQGEKFDVMLDDRGLRFGESMKDAELIGCPVTIVVGRAWNDRLHVEMKFRDSRFGENQEVHRDHIGDFLRAHSL